MNVMFIYKSVQTDLYSLFKVQLILNMATKNNELQI